MVTRGDAAALSDASAGGRRSRNGLDLHFLAHHVLPLAAMEHAEEERRANTIGEL